MGCIIPISVLLLLMTAAAAAAAAATTTKSEEESEDPFSLVFKGCSNETFSSTTSLLPSLAALSSSLVSHSSSSRFFKTTTSGTTSTGLLLTALYQCRGDLPISICSACVRRLPSLWSDLCPPLTAAARVHLSGCYALYHAAGFPQVALTSTLFHTCSPPSSSSVKSRGEAFAKLESAAASAGEPSEEGFYRATKSGGWIAAGQCEGELSVADCGDCLSEAVKKVEIDCGASSAGEMYLDKCFLLYTMTGDEERGGDATGGGGSYLDDGGRVGRSDSRRGFSDEGITGEHTQKTVAIVIGGAAGVGFLVIFMLCFRSLHKKEEY